MPRIVELKEVDGKLAVLLDMPTDDEGTVTIWTEDEKQAAFASIRKVERETCAQIAETTPPGTLSDIIAKAIREQE